MKILYAAIRYDYGRPEQGPSFEHHAFYDTLTRLGHEIIYFDFVELAAEHGRAWVNRRLWEIARAEDPELMFCVLFGEELEKEVVRRISDDLRTVTINWFCDDHWRFYDFSRAWAPCFNWVVSTAPAAVAPYEKHGLHNVIRSQWAYNHFTFTPLEDQPPHYDVTFVGMAHGDRRALIDAIRRAGVDVRTWGTGWPTGRLSVPEMVRVFSHSRINLNLSESWLTAAAVETKRRADTRAGLEAAADPSLSSRLRGRARLLPGASRTVRAVRAAARQLGGAPSLGRHIQQLKARTFEVPGYGGFLLTQDAPELERYFEIGAEIAVFRDTAGLLEQLRYYLDHEHERIEIAAAGHARARDEHTYERRFEQIFSAAGIAS